MENLEKIKVRAPELHALSTPLSARQMVLLVGNDESLRYSRRLLLERVGLGVLSLDSSQALPGMAFTCNLALLCRSVLFAEADRIAHALHVVQAAMPVLRFASDGEASSQDFTSVLMYGVSPQVLLDEVKRLLHPGTPRPFRLSREANA